MRGNVNNVILLEKIRAREKANSVFLNTSSRVLYNSMVYGFFGTYEIENSPISKSGTSIILNIYAGEEFTDNPFRVEVDYTSTDGAAIKYEFIAIFTAIISSDAVFEGFELNTVAAPTISPTISGNVDFKADFNLQSKKLSIHQFELTVGGNTIDYLEGLPPPHVAQSVS